MTEKILWEHIGDDIHKTQINGADYFMYPIAGYLNVGQGTWRIGSFKNPVDADAAVMEHAYSIEGSWYLADPERGLFAALP